jgi:hypothetical protein
MKYKFLVLWLTGVLSTVVALPYIFALQHEVLEKSPLTLLQIGLIAIAQAAVLLAVAVFFGLKLSKSINLPIGLFSGSNLSFQKKLNHIAKISIPIGIVTALVIKFADFFFSKNIPQLAVAAKQIPIWKALMVAPYGGVVEELLMRLFVVSLIAWLAGKITRSSDVAKNNVIMWVAIVIAAIIFGLGHLPATATVTQITPMVVARAILLNGMAGLAFGWLYWKRGLDYAIAAHFTADIVLIAILPAILG